MDKPAGIELFLRPCLIEDKDFVYNVKKSTMKSYVEKSWGVWDENFQRRRFNRNFNLDNSQIMQLNGEDIGILIIEENPMVIQIDNIQILPDYQNEGIGSMILTNIIQKAVKKGKTVKLQVLKTNPKAKKLYEHLGFFVEDETEFHFLMRK